VSAPATGSSGRALRIKQLPLQKIHRPILTSFNASGAGPVRFNSALSARGQAAGLILLRHPRFVKNNQHLSVA